MRPMSHRLLPRGTPAWVLLLALAALLLASSCVRQPDEVLLKPEPEDSQSEE